MQAPDARASARFSVVTIGTASERAETTDLSLKPADLADWEAISASAVPAAQAGSGRNAPDRAVTHSHEVAGRTGIDASRARRLDRKCDTYVRTSTDRGLDVR